MAYVTPIGANPEQVEYRLSEAHGCGGTHGTDRQFSYHADGRERPLRWIGRGLSEFGIEPGSVLDEAQFDAARSLMAGRDPRTGEVLVDAKRAVADDAKVALAPLVRAVEAVAAEADVSTAEVLGQNTKLVAAFDRARRAVDARGEAARLRADEAGQIADAAGVSVEDVWGEEVYEQAAANLWETVSEQQDDGTVKEARRPRRIRVGNAGYDITFTLPKSLSLLLAFADEDTAAQVERVYMQGVEDAFAWVEQTTAYGMRGKHGQGYTADTVRGSGLLGWTMVHRAARPVEDAEAGDPHWHVHLTVANMTRGEDGQWSTIAAGGRDLMRHAAAVDHITKALVRHQLAEQFGVRFDRNTRTGAWELTGMPDAALQQFSKRHSDIKAMLAELGYDPAEASRTQDRIAEQRSRGAKGEATAAADATLQHLWQGEERQAGRDPGEHVRRVFGGGTDPMNPDEPPDGPQDPDTDAAGSAATPSVEEIAAQLLDPEHGLTAHSRRFTRADALARVADALPYGFSCTAEVEELTDRVLEAVAFVALPEYDQQVTGPNGEHEYLAAGHMANAATYTTQDVVDDETVILRTAKASHEHQLPTRVSDAAFELGVNVVDAQQPFALDAEQRAAVHRVTTSGRAIETVTGRPGTGKTTIMRAVRAIYEAAGYVVGGAATAAVAAQNLHTESGISARTVAAYVGRIQDGDEQVLRGVDALVLDEANLTEDRDRAVLYQRAAVTGTQIIEIGDGRQLRGVGLGSLFARVHEIVDGAELTNNRRQADEDERAAIDAWRDRRYTEALSLWAGNGQFHATEQTHEVTAAMVAEWWRQRQGAPSEHTEMRGLAMLAATNEQVGRLNEAAQAVRAAEGELGAGHTYDVAGGRRLRLHVGEHILVRVNDRAGALTSGPPVLNGYRAVIRAIDERGAVTAEWQRETPDGVRTETAQLSAAYVGLGGVELGYGLTIHKAEGLTVGGQHGSWQRPDGQQHFGRVLFSAPGADNPAAYVALSRHKQQVDVFGALDQLESEQQRYLDGPPRTRGEVTDRAIAALAEHAKNTETHGDDRPVVADLGISEFLAETAADRQATAARQADEAETAAEREEHAAEHEARERRRAERDRVRAEREETKQHRRTWAAQLLREVWRHQPSLAESVIIAAAFDVVARNLADAEEAGYDARDVLAELPTATINSPRVRDPARFTAWGIDHAVERMRSGQTERDEQQAAERTRFAQMREQTGELLDEVWSHRPELAEAVAASSAFDAFVTSLDSYVSAGLDPRELLGQVNTAKLDDPSIRDTGAFAAYSLRRVGDRQLDEIDEAHRRAEARAAAEQQQTQTAELLRQAWSHAPEAAERVITGPAFRLFTEQVTAAQRDGHDAGHLLRVLNPATLTGPGVPNPSGTVTFAFQRAVEAAEHTPAAPTEPASAPVDDGLLAAARAWANTRPEPTPPVQPTPSEQAAGEPELDRLARVQEAAARYYQRQLDEHSGELDYLADRLPDVDAARRAFTVGYAPNQWRSLTDHLRGEGYTDQDLLDAGVAKESRNGGLIDRLRGRIVLGVRDEHGRLAGWIGRDRTGRDEAPKYLNTPGTALYDKSRVVFGLHEQRGRLADGATPVVVEGTFDVMALAASPAGEQVVPVTTSGTAVTTQHLQALERATDSRGQLVIGLDGDAAGQAAAARTAQRALSLGISARVITLPDGHDPASWLSAHPETPEQAAAPYLDPDQQQPAAELITDTAIEHYFADHPPQHREETDGRLAAARAAASALPAEVDLETATSTGLRIAERTGADPSAVMSMIGQQRASGRSEAPLLELATPEPDATTTDVEPEPGPEPGPEPVEHESLAVEPESEGPVEPDLDVGQPSPQPDLAGARAGEIEPAGAARPVPHWSTREFGAVGEDELAERTEQAQQRAARAAGEHEQAQQRAESQRAAAEAGDGSEVRAVDEHLAGLREHATLARETDEVETSWHSTLDRAASAAEQRTRAEYERDTLGRFARGRRAELTRQIDELREQETTAQQEAADLAERASHLQGQVGGQEQRRRLLTRANAAEADYEHARAAAQRRDEQAAEAAERRTARLAEQHTEHEQQARALAAERQLREQLPEQARELEQAERAAALQPAEATVGEAELSAGQVQEPIAGVEQQAQIEQETPQPDPGEPEM